MIKSLKLQNFNCVVRFCNFFFSSRRRHTRLTCDWSSDVCSSDLVIVSLLSVVRVKVLSRRVETVLSADGQVQTQLSAGDTRSEERRVGKECRSWWSPNSKKKKKYHSKDGK